MGDDTTDTGAFEALRDLGAQQRIRTLSIAVSNPEAPAEVVASANCVVGGPGDVASLLNRLADELCR